MANAQFRPVISVITVVYNAEEVIEPTLLSVFEQDYDNYEYVVVDGGSTDYSLEILSKYQSKFAAFISEPDEGVYDAMNKGMNLASGDYILFLNAGDLLYDKHVLSSVGEIMKDGPDVVYGDTALIDAKGKEKAKRRLRPPRHLSWKQLKYGMLVCHQSFFVRRARAGYYDLRYHYSADYDWMIRILKQSNYIKNSGLIISKFLLGGMTKKKRFSSLYERFKVMSRHYGWVTGFFMHGLFVFRFIYSFGKQVIGKSFFDNSSMR